MSLKQACLFAALGFWFHASGPLAVADAIPGQIDDFEDGTTFGWQHGLPNPDEPRVVENGGPDGTGDAFLQFSSNGSFGPGGKLIMFNDHERWTGSYGGDESTAPVVRLEVELNNMGEEPLTLWFSFDGEYATDDGGTTFGSVETGGFELAPGSGWQHASFSLLPADLTSSNSNIVKSLDNVSRVWFFHNSMEPVHPAPPLEAILGVDNLAAIGDIVIDPLIGDYNDNGRVEQGDLDLVLLNWGQPFNTLPATWANQRPSQGIVDQAELDGVLLNWGKTASGSETASAVPEPSTVWLLLVASVFFAMALIASASAPAPAGPR